MESNEKVTAYDIVAEVSMMLNDTDFKQGLSRGYYLNAVQRSFETLNIQTFMTAVTRDIPFPEKQLTMDMPDDAFNVREMYLHNGVCCQPGSDMAIVHWKRLYNNSQGGPGYTALKKEEQANDYLYNPWGIGTDMQFDGNPLYWGNIENGLIMFSSNCRKYKYVRIVYNSMGGKIGEEINIPRIVRECITLMTAKRVCTALMARDKNYATMYQAITGQLDAPRTGIMDEAKLTLNRMGTWKRNNYLDRSETNKY